MSAKLFTTLLVSLVLTGSYTLVADAQQQPSPRRGTVKAHTRYFNPFEVSRTRVTVDRFGVVHFANGMTISPGAAQAAKAAVASTAAVATATALPSAPAALASSASASAASLDPATNFAEAPAQASEGLLVPILTARPPFRPPVRSPFRPPPRPPF